MMSHVGFTRLAVRFSVIVSLIWIPMGAGCVEAELQSGVFACDTDGECPPGGFFCDNYFNSYVYGVDVNARPTIYDFWGSCVSSDKVVAKQGAGADRVFAEICSNGKDDDGDGLVDCDDLECQTAPTCSVLIKQQCTSGNTNPPCDNLLGFPFPGPGTGTVDDVNCPKSVGVVFSQDPPICLPRCRLYFKAVKLVTEPYPDELFQGSDRYCDEFVRTFATAGEYVSGELECVHLNLVKNSANQFVQNDVCLPKTRFSDGTCGGACAGECVEILYRDRTLLTSQIDERTAEPKHTRLVAIDGHTFESTQKTGWVCLTSNR